MRRVLFISLKFPPLSDIGAKRPLRFVRRLPREGWQPVVLTLPEGLPGQHDADLAARIPPDAIVHRSYADGPLFRIIDRAKHEWAISVGRTVAPTAVKKAGAPAAGRAVVPAASKKRGVIYALEDIAEGLWPTDEWLPFVYAGAAEAVRLVNEYGCEAIYVCGDPNSSYLAAWRAHRITGRPLVLDMRDPWTLDPTIKKLKFGLTQRLEESWEERIFNEAAAVILNTETSRAAYHAFYPAMPRDKFHVIPNAFDAELVNDHRPVPDKGFTVAHFGNYHRLRSARVFLDGFKRFIDALKPTEPKFVNYGEFRPDDLAYAASIGLGDVVEVRPYVAYPDYLGDLRRARVLLLEQRNEQNVQIPGKFYDYALVGRPILNLARNAELERIIETAHLGVNTSPDDPAAVAAALGRIAAGSLDDWERGIDHDVLYRCSGEATTRALAAVLDRVTA